MDVALFFEIWKEIRLGLLDWRLGYGAWMLFGFY
jgi:hypothetical protein